MTGSGDQPHDQAFAPLDRDRHLSDVAANELGELPEDTHKLVLGVLNQPALHERTLIVDQAYPVHS